MTKFKTNLIANFAGTIWSAFLSLILVPVYISFLGVESYGLIGFYVSLTSVLFLLDVGLSTTLNREIARLSENDSNNQVIRDLVRTLELVYWGIAILIAVVVVGMAPILATHWVKSVELSIADLTFAIRLMGFVIALQFPYALYSGGLLGLQRHALLNVANAVNGTIRGLGAVAVLAVAPTIHTFFEWQIITAAVQTVSIAVILYRNLPRGIRSARFDPDLLRQVARFATGMTGIAVLATLLTQVDKIVLSRILSLEDFGYYSVATTIASGVALLVSPFAVSAFPRFSEIVAQRDEAALELAYHRSSQFLAALLIPVALVLIFFPREILLVWTHNQLVADHTALFVSLLVCGAVLNGLYQIPHVMQLAHGWTTLALYQNIGAVFVLIPVTIVAGAQWGGVGVAVAWIILNLGYIVIGVGFMHTRILKQHKRRWYLEDVGPSVVVALTVVIPVRAVVPPAMSPVMTIMMISLTLGLSLVGSCMVTVFPRRYFLEELTSGSGLLDRLRNRKS